MSSIAQFFPPSIRIWSVSLSFLTVRLKIIAKAWELASMGSYETTGYHFNHEQYL